LERAAVERGAAEVRDAAVAECTQVGERESDPVRVI
jgi:hypothetical protein